jgi:hypothetical protein
MIGSGTENPVLSKSQLGAEEVAQVVECLPSLHKALSLNSSTAKNKQNQAGFFAEIGKPMLKCMWKFKDNLEKEQSWRTVLLILKIPIKLQMVCCWYKDIQISYTFL